MYTGRWIQVSLSFTRVGLNAIAFLRVGRMRSIK